MTMKTEILVNSFNTILRKETKRIFRIWPQTLLPSVITQSLYFLIFGGFVGSRVGEMGGVPYMTFIVPGLVMMAVIQNSFMNVVSTFFSAKFMKSLDELMVSPTPPWIVLAGFTAGGMVRGVVTGALVLGVSLFFTRPPVAHWWAIALFLFLTAMLFSLGGFFNGIFAKKWDDIGIFSSFVLTPLTYLGGVFYSVSSLPPFWQAVSKLNPILYMVDGFRYGFFGESGVPVWQSAALLVVGNLVLIAVNLHLLRKGTGMRN
jgi:ABC-2 type transport system permease protein